jgi:hypothetical protein
MVKNFFTIVIISLILCSTLLSQQTRITTNRQEVQKLFNNSPILPDVMGRINYIPPAGATIPAEVDSFSLFNGFPQEVSGSSLEGGIFCNLDNDPELEFVYCISYTVQAFNMDGTPVTGWPKTLSQPTQSAPAFGDIDGDGEGEIVVTTIFGTSSGTIYAWHKDGTPVTGFPVNHGYSARTPVLADLDDDGAMEIIVNKRIYPLGEEWVYKGDGTVMWSQSLNHVPASSAAVGDITGDGVPEVVCESYESLYAMDNMGNILPGFPFNPPAGVTNSYSSPVLVDVDGDNIREIVFGSQASSGQGYVHIIKNDGTVYPGWPKTTGNWVYTPPAVGYINGDTILDIAVGDQILSTTPVDFVYAWDVNGNALPGFPIGPLNAINSQIILADMDNNGSTDLIFDDNGLNVYHGYNSNGTILSGWPITVTGDNTFYEMPALADINNDGVLDLIGAGNQGFGSSAVVFIHLWDTGYPFVPDNYTLPVFQYNERHNGVYGDLGITIPVELVSFSGTVTGNDVVLKWSTATETNNRGFNIERGIDKSSFVNIGFIKGNGTTTEKSTYTFTDKNINKGDYYYRLKQIDFDGTYSYSRIINVNAGGKNLSYRLEQNYPNPFNPATSINYSIPEKTFVRLEIYNSLGQKIKSLINGIKEAGNYSLGFNAVNLPSGIYYYKLDAGKFSETKKMVILK